MTFYIKPPEGKLSLKKLHQDAEIRLQFLHQIYQHVDREEILNTTSNFPSIVLHSDCIIDSSLRDRTSHFILRYACLNIGLFQRFLIDAETILFKYRLVREEQSFLENKLLNLIRHISYALKHHHLSCHHHEFLQEIHEVVTNILSCGMIKCCNKTSCHHSVKVPWTLVSAQVKDRYVIVENGKVDIPCHFLQSFLCTVFQDTITYGIKEMLFLADEKLDPRLSIVRNSLRKLFLSKFEGNTHLDIPHSLRCQDVERQSRLFPLCMQQLHQILKRTNRLRHHARFRYTLFLKDIGLQVNENIAFWEQYYSKPSESTASGCSHSWTGNTGTRYKYSIRHVYGLEGGRINYSSHSCSALQGLQPQPSEVGGCPFVGESYSEIFSVLKSVYGNTPFLLKLMSLAMEGKPSSACKLSMKYTALMLDLEEESVQKSHFKQSGRRIKDKMDSSETLCPVSEQNYNFKFPSIESLCNTKRDTPYDVEPTHGVLDLCTFHTDIPGNNEGSNLSCSNCTNHQLRFDSICDIEDVSFLSKCEFYKPSQYYLQARAKRKVN